MLEDVIKLWGGCEVSALEVYEDVFHFGEGYIQNENEEKGKFKANPIAYWKNEGSKHGHYRVLFEDTFADTLKELQEADFCILNGLSYFGRKNCQDHASKMFAMIFDLDDVNDKTLNAFLNGAYEVDAYPIPNYIILSGHGLHLYYLFEDPIPLFPNIKIQLKEFKYALTDKIWNSYTSFSKTKQFQGINQPFRIIGGKTKKDALEKRVKAFRLNNHPFSLKELGEYIPDAYKVDESKLFRESKMSLAEAKEKYPEWYQKVVVEKNKNRSRWKIEEKVNGKNPYALYDWWKRKIQEGAAYNHRYFCIMCLAIYGVKCGVEYEKVKKDAYDFIPFLNGINPAKPFKASDVDSALECYDLRYVSFPIRDLEKISAIRIDKNKRNYRKQDQHLKIARFIRDLNNENWRENNGRKSKQTQVEEWQKKHPNGSKAECSRETWLDPKTIRKWWR